MTTTATATITEAIETDTLTGWGIAKAVENLDGIESIIRHYTRQADNGEIRRIDEAKMKIELDYDENDDYGLVWYTYHAPTVPGIGMAGKFDKDGSFIGKTAEEIVATITTWLSAK